MEPLKYLHNNIVTHIVHIFHDVVINYFPIDSNIVQNVYFFKFKALNSSPIDNPGDKIFFILFMQPIFC